MKTFAICCLVFSFFCFIVVCFIGCDDRVAPIDDKTPPDIYPISSDESEGDADESDAEESTDEGTDVVNPIDHDAIPISPDEMIGPITPDNKDEGSKADENSIDVITGEEASQVAVDELKWISDNGVLHNSLCRWYKKCSGKEWDGVEEHKNCNTCGGDTPIVHRWNLPSDTAK